MTEATYDRDFWERRWAQALREQPERVAKRPLNAHLVEGIRELTPALALDAGNSQWTPQPAIRGICCP